MFPLGVIKVVHLRYSRLSNLSALDLEGWGDLLQLDVSYNQLSSLGIQINTPLSHLMYLDVSGNNKLRTLQSIQVLQPHLRVLIAARCNLSDVSALEDFNLLELLDLQGNLLTTMPSRLPGLVKLNLRGNLIEKLPAGMCGATGLIELNLQGIQLKTLPEGFGNLTQLEKLNLRANRLSNISEVARLSSLRSLDVTKPGNGISFTLCDLSALSNVNELRLVGIRITEIPKSILDLPHLFFLDLSSNSITAVPSHETLLQHAVPWRRVNLSSNSLTEFPVSLLFLQGLEHVCVGNNVFELPEPVVAMEPSEALSFWRKQFNVSFTSSRRTSASSETLGALIAGSELFNNFSPTAEQTDVQESIWFDLYSYRSEVQPHVPIPQATLGQLGRELILDRFAGCLYGLALGDAVGLATEFLTKDVANFYYDIERGFQLDELLPDQHRSMFSAGDWTDDTDQNILILDNLVANKGQFDAVTFGASLQKWVNNGFPELGDTAGCGCGKMTYDVIAHSSFKSKPHVAAAAVWEASGRNSAPNGALMRTPVLGCAQFWNLQKVISETTSACQTTHADPRCVASSVALSSAISSLLSSDPSATYIERIETAIATALDAARPFIASCPEKQREEFEFYTGNRTLSELNLGEPRAIGYTFKALGAAFYALRDAQNNNFIDIITKITLEAGDADTNCAVAGSLLGALLGFRLLPAQWISQLQHHEWMNRKLKSFLDLYGICLEL